MREVKKSTKRHDLLTEHPAHGDTFTNSHNVVAHPGSAVEVNKQEYVESRLQQKERTIRAPNITSL